jgi:hypothetical protein
MVDADSQRMTGAMSSGGSVWPRILSLKAQLRSAWRMASAGQGLWLVSMTSVASMSASAIGRR